MPIACLPFLTVLDMTYFVKRKFSTNKDRVFTHDFFLYANFKEGC